MSKFLKGLMQETPLEFQGVKFERSLGRTLASKRGEPEKMFLILKPKSGMHEGRLS